VCVGYTSCTRNISDNSKTTSKSILMFIMSHETVIIANVTLFETGLLQWIILKCVS
jgi:hypothetical protein